MHERYPDATLHAGHRETLIGGAKGVIKRRVLIEVHSGATGDEAEIEVEVEAFRRFIEKGQEVLDLLDRAAQSYGEDKLSSHEDRTQQPRG